MRYLELSPRHTRYESREVSMARFIIQPHFRLQEWVAEEKGYFAAEGLEYEFHEEVQATDGGIHDQGDKVGAYQSLEAGRSSDVSCACHWTVNVAASNRHGRMYAEAYSVAPSGIFVPPDSVVRTPADLAGVPVSVGYQSGSHYSTVQALEQYMPAKDINLSFADGMLFARMAKLLDGNLPAVSLFNGPYYFAEQLGYRKVIDTTFMIAAMITGAADPEDLRSYFRALRRTQRDIVVGREKYSHYYSKEFRVRYHAMMDTRRWGPGERLVFEPYTREAYEDSFRWIREHGMFDTDMGSGVYDDAVMKLPQ